MIRIFCRQIERLRREDGQAMIFVALVGLVIFLFLAMTMNVAELVNTKIKNQNVADAAALSAAVWQARTLNLVSALNRNMLELWGLGLPAAQACFAAGLTCQYYVCGEFAVDPLPCLACLALTFSGCDAAYSFLAGAMTTGLFQDVILDTLDRNVVDPDLPQVVDLNYSFKPNTDSDDVGLYAHFPLPGEDLLRVYPQGEADSGDYALERVGVCEIVIMLARYANYWWHVAGEPSGGLTDDVWNSYLPTVYDWYSAPDGECYHKAIVPPGVEAMFPLGIRSRATDWTRQDVEDLLAVTVATYKAQEPPAALGKGTGPADCTWSEGDTRFACTNHRHYAFASAHAFSEEVSEFYNTDLAGLATSELVPYIPFEMSWEARLFPIDEDGYLDILEQIDQDGFSGDHDMLLRNVLQWNGMNFFLY